MITNQLPVKAWHDVIGEPTFADAILDRIVHNAYRLELEANQCARPSLKWVTKLLRTDNQNTLPHGNASEVGAYCWNGWTDTPGDAILENVGYKHLSDLTRVKEGETSEIVGSRHKI